jgi:TonB-dependent starch-binding outer membrane protein SusC
MKKNIRLSCLLCLSVMAFEAQAQIILTGSVKAADGGPLVGASILVKNTMTGGTVDAEGLFKLQLDEKFKTSSLIFSFIGFVPQELPIGERTTFDVVLEEDATQLTEVVVIGYTVQEKGKITGAVSTVTEQMIGKLPLPTLDQALQGRAPGVVVTQNTGAPGEGVSVRIRGAGSINSGNNPLYVVDGIPTLDINSIATQDISSITVLKDAGATAIYGSRAANGVVLVTTKSGGSSAPKIEFSSQAGVQSASRKIAMTNVNDYVTVYNEAANNDNVGKPVFLLRSLITPDIQSTLSDVDYIDAIMRDGVLQSHSISVSGGDGKTRYFISGNYFDQQGIIKSSDYNRVSSRINIDTEVKKWLRAGINLNISKATTNFIGSSGDGAGGNGGSVIRYAFFRTPAIPIYDANGDFTDKPERYDLFGDGYSPVGMLAYNNNKQISNRLFGKFFMDVTPFKDFKFTSNLGVDFTSGNQRRFDRHWGTGGRINNPNQLSVTDVRFQTISSSNFATYTKSFGQHGFTFLLGIEAIRSQAYQSFGSDKNFPDQSTNLVYLGNGLGLKFNRESKSANSLLSYFGKINYDFQEKYIASVTLRRDGSSRFGPDNRWGTFYGGSVGWRIDKEKFLLNSQFIDRLLLRAGYGSIGNQEIGDYAFTDAINSGNGYPLGNSPAVGYSVSNLGNSKIKWESSKQFNVGADLEIWNGKFSASLDYFNKVTTDLLVKQPIASSAGEAQPPWVNNGEILNRGFELALNYSGKIKELNYSISANGATIHNEVLAVNAPISGGAIGSDRVTRTEVGNPIGSFYLYEMEGIFQNSTDIFTHAFQGNGIKPGDVKFKDQMTVDTNGDGAPDAGDGRIDGNDRTHVGSPIPKLTAGLNINLSYKSFDLSVFFQGAYGQKIFSVLNRDIEGFYRPFNVTQRYFDNRWTGEGTSNEYPRASWDASGNNARYSTRFLEDGSYTRLKNVQLGYTIPKSLLERVGFSSLRIYFSGTNLLTFSKYSGMDPEMTVSDNAKGQGDSAAGLDWGTYPSAKSFNMGINLTF